MPCEQQLLRLYYCNYHYYYLYLLVTAVTAAIVCNIQPPPATLPTSTIITSHLTRDHSSDAVHINLLVPEIEQLTPRPATRRSGRKLPWSRQAARQRSLVHSFVQFIPWSAKWPVLFILLLVVTAEYLINGDCGVRTHANRDGRIIQSTET